MDFKNILKQLKQNLNIDETYTKPTRTKETIINDFVKSNTYPKQDFNFMADLLYLPTTKKGFKYLLVAVDLWSNEVEAEPLKNKDPEDIVNAFETIFKRGTLKKPFSSIRTDAGTEFKGKFEKYCFEHSILHRVSLPNRHKQTGNVENSNKIIARLLNGVMNAKEAETGKIYREWDKVLKQIITALNSRKRPDENPYKKQYPLPTEKTPKFKIGDIVIYKLEVPRNALNNNQPTNNFRVGDYRWNYKAPKEIKKILYYENNIRYILNTLPNVSYAENELKKAVIQAEKFDVKEIIGKKLKDGITYYKVWWKGYLKKDSTFEPEEQLIDDGFEAEIDKYEMTH